MRIQSHTAIESKGCWYRSAYCSEQAGLTRTASPHHGMDDALWNMQVQMVDQRCSANGKTLYSELQTSNLRGVHFRHSLTGVLGLNRRGRPAHAATPNISAGSSHCSHAYAAVNERCAPLASVTASVVTVVKRPAPTNNVGRYWATLTAKPTANADPSAALSKGHLTCIKKDHRN